MAGYGVRGHVKCKRSFGKQTGHLSSCGRPCLGKGTLGPSTLPQHLMHLMDGTTSTFHSPDLPTNETQRARI